MIVLASGYLAPKHLGVTALEYETRPRRPAAHETCAL
jgi:hypothetical protein